MLFDRSRSSGSLTRLSLRNATPSKDNICHPRQWLAGRGAWTADFGLTDVGSFGGIETITQHVNSSGLAAGFSALPSGRIHAFVWTKDTGLTDIDPGSTEDSSARWVSETGLVVGSTYPAEGERVFTWSLAAGKAEIPALSPSMRPDF